MGNSEIYVNYKSRVLCLECSVGPQKSQNGVGVDIARRNILEQGYLRKYAINYKGSVGFPDLNSWIGSLSEAEKGVYVKCGFGNQLSSGGKDPEILEDNILNCGESKQGLALDADAGGKIQENLAFESEGVEKESSNLEVLDSGPTLRSKKGPRREEQGKSEVPTSDIVEETVCNKENNKNLENLQENYF